jgi:hypothetical protein
VKGHTHLDTEERHLLRFVLTWAPYGGPAEADVFCQFGITKLQLLQRFNDTIDAMFAANPILTPPDAQLVIRARNHQLTLTHSEADRAGTQQ